MERTRTKIFLIAGILCAIVIFVSVSSVFAVSLGTDLLENAGESSGYETTPGATTETTFAENLGLVLRTLLSFVGIIFLALSVYAGFLWMTARGAEDVITKAQDILRAAIIGIIITLGSYGVTAFVVNTVLEKTGVEAPVIEDDPNAEVQAGCCTICYDIFLGKTCQGEVEYKENIASQEVCSADCPSGGNCEFDEGKCVK